MQRRGEIEQVRGFLVDLDRAACGDACEQAVAAVMRILAVKTVAFGAYRRKRGLRDGFRGGLQMQGAGTTHAGEFEFVYRAAQSELVIEAGEQPRVTHRARIRIAAAEAETGR